MLVSAVTVEGDAVGGGGTKVEDAVEEAADVVGKELGGGDIGKLAGALSLPSSSSSSLLPLPPCSFDAATVGAPGADGFRVGSGVGAVKS